MARRVLLVDPDVDALGELAAALRSRGFNVVLADDVPTGIDRAREAQPDIVLASAAVCFPGELVDRLRADPELARIPRIVLVHEASAGLPDGCVVRTDFDALTARIAAVPPRAVPVEAPGGELRGKVEQVSLVDLLQLLAMNRRTGVLSVTTSAGAGELRLADGEVIDAVYRRLDGEKALYRLLGETEGNFAFLPGQTTALRRVNVPTSMLLMEAMRQFDEVAKKKGEVAPGGDALIVDDGAGEGASALEHLVAEVLKVPKALDEVLDEIQAPDLEVLEAMHRMAGRGLLRRIPRAALVATLASPERMGSLRALVTRLARDGFSGPPRLAIAGSAGQLASLGRALLRIEDALPPTDPPPAAPVPHTLATLRFGESVDLAIIAIPVAPTFAPLWPLAIGGTAALVRLDGDEAPDLDAACAAAEVPVAHASAILGWIEEGDPSQVAALIRLTLENVLGA